ncbi:SUMO-interacting motif-containing protein 1-like [Acipenser oxyrinchus oxyrinchus]|uniref:SUMO-interacting motif-containing protein 1-like n=1 Tax=Acipenser oxyrinchus oxyrinchus TaxID=40147 RepID=A0AAD8FXP2_ACIOX|nr:SUMO-interacting motif-containing protein 1-like [Acipenser oxyrinchus oxyrinchus]
MNAIIDISSGSEEEPDLEIVGVFKRVCNCKKSAGIKYVARNVIDLTQNDNDRERHRHRKSSSDLTVEVVDLSKCSSPTESSRGQQSPLSSENVLTILSEEEEEEEEVNPKVNESSAATSAMQPPDLGLSGSCSLSDLPDTDISSPTLPQYQFLEDSQSEILWSPKHQNESYSSGAEKEDPFELCSRGTKLLHSIAAPGVGTDQPCSSDTNSAEPREKSMEPSEVDCQRGLDTKEPQDRQSKTPPPSHELDKSTNWPFTVSCSSGNRAAISSEDKQGECRESSSKRWQPEGSTDKLLCLQCSIKNLPTDTKQPSGHSLTEQQQGSPNCSSQIGSSFNEQKAVEASSPTSTDILAGDSPDWLMDCDLPSPQLDSPDSLPFVDEMESYSEPWNSLSDGKASPLRSPPLLRREVDGEGDKAMSECYSSVETEQELEEEPEQDFYYIDRAKRKRLSLLTGMPIQHMLPWRMTEEEEDQDDDGSDLSEEEAPREPISQRRLRLALCTIEESYPQATLQFLFDFMSPRYYPPADTVNHVLREILLNSDSPILAEEAYTLLMKIQLFHPADLSTVQWDWELLSSVMDEKDHKKSQSLTTGPLFLQYVVQTLEDDFQRRVGQQSLQLSIVKAMLSCDRKFTHVRDVVDWLIGAVTNITRQEKKKKTGDDYRLKVVCLLQKMLALAVEVDRSPTCSSNKLSEEMFQSFFGSALRRQHIVQLLNTMESQLLCCKLLELLLGYTCPLRTQLHMSLGLILHFLRHAELPSDTTGGAEERWQRWDDLLNLLVLLFHSYQEVTNGYLRVSITERAKHYGTRPAVIEEDKITEMEVESDLDIFRSRVSKDLGEPLNLQLEERFSQLQALLLNSITGKNQYTCILLM